MKLYLFYISKELYAWTNDSSIKRDFKNTHNSKFIKKTIEVTETQFIKFSNFYYNKELSYMNLDSLEIVNGLQQVTSVKVPLTEEEYESIINYITNLFDTFYEIPHLENLYEIYNNQAFNANILYILKELLLIEDMVFGFLDESTVDKFQTSDIIFDQFEIYIRLYKNLLRG